MCTSFMESNLMISPRSLKSVHYIIDKKRLYSILDHVNSNYESKLQKLQRLKDEYNNLRK